MMNAVLMRGIIPEGGAVGSPAVPITTLKIPSVTLAELIEAAKPDFVPLPTLEELALTAPNPLPLDDLAVAVGVQPELLRRVSAGRQPLPAQLLPLVAARLGLQEGEVAGAARSLTRAGDKLLPGLQLGERALTPLPPDRLLGDPIYLLPVTPTVPPAFGP